jgi:hypothetical protein
MASDEGHIHWSGGNDETVNYLGQELRMQVNENPGDPIGALHIHADGFVGEPLFLPNSNAQSPTWTAVPGTAPTLEVRQDGHYPQSYIRIRQA